MSVALVLGLSAAEGEAPRAAERRLGEETWPFITIRGANFDQLVKPDVLDPCDRAFAFLGVQPGTLVLE